MHFELCPKHSEPGEGGCPLCAMDAIERAGAEQATRADENQAVMLRYREALECIQADLVTFQNPDKPECNAVWFASRTQFHLTRTAAAAG